MSIAEQKEQLLLMLKDPSNGVREAASEALAHLESSERIADLVRRIGSGKPSEQVEAVYSLEHMPTRDALQMLAKLLSHPIVDIRAAALRVVLNRRDTRFTKQVLERLRDKDNTVAALAAEVLGVLGDKRVEAALVQEIREAPDSVRAALLVALGRIGSGKAPRLALNAAKAKSAAIRQAAAQVLGMVVED